ncbi:MAG TPA: 50S ribosomal protein L29 [Bacteroidia bacterium]|nr:50S ribosomal protein L29 [Bacteroidia bacterium]
MKQEEIKNLTINELRDRLSEEVAQLDKLKLNHSVSPIENPLKIRTTRRTIARLRTELSVRDKASTNNN